MADPKAFEIAHGDLAYNAYTYAENHYRNLGGQKVLWRRSDLNALLDDNWPCFVDLANPDEAAAASEADSAALLADANSWYSQAQLEEIARQETRD